MRRRNLLFVAGLLCATVGLVTAQSMLTSATTPAPAQQIKRTPLQRFDVPGTHYETVIGLAEVVPNVGIGRHVHPGVEAGYVLEGEMVLRVDGQADKLVKAGESYQVPPGAVHDGLSGPQGAKVVATYVVEKGKPFATAVK